MSESEYSLGEEVSDEEYENSEQPKPRLRLAKKPR